MLIAVWTILLAPGFTVPVASSQSLTGEVAGRVTTGDEQRSDLPGVHVTVFNGHQSQQAITDDAGRFAVRSLPFGTYRVVLELVGFRSISGEITLSPSLSRSFLAWNTSPCCGQVGTPRANHAD